MPTFEDLFALLLDVFIHSSNSFSKAYRSVSDDLFTYTGVLTNCKYSSASGFTLIVLETHEDKTNINKKKIDPCFA